MREPACEVDPPRDEQREVVETGRARNRSRAGLLDEHEQLASTGSERRAAAAELVQIETDRGAVVAERPFEIRNREMNRTDGRRGRELDGDGRRRRVELFGIARRPHAPIVAETRVLPAQ